MVEDVYKNGRRCIKGRVLKTVHHRRRVSFQKTSKNYLPEKGHTRTKLNCSFRLRFLHMSPTAKMNYKTEMKNGAGRESSIHNTVLLD